MNAIEDLVNFSMKEYGPFATMKLIGAKGYQGVEEDTGLVKEIKALEQAAANYRPSREYRKNYTVHKGYLRQEIFCIPSAKRGDRERIF